MNHHAFISYPSSDSEIASTLTTLLDANNIRCWMDRQRILLSTGWDEEIARAIAASRVFLLLITAATLEKPKEQKRELSIAERFQVPVIPIFIIPPRDCLDFVYLLATTQHFDASEPPILDRFEAAVLEIHRLLATLDAEKLRRAKATAPLKSATVVSAALTDVPEKAESQGQSIPRSTARCRALNSAEIAILYRRGVPEDERILELLETRLEERGHSVFVDRKLAVGAEWRRTIREKVESADVVIPLLSLFSVGSEMLEEELQIACRAGRANGGTPRILPVRVKYEGVLSAGMTQCLQKLQYFLWTNREDDADLVATLIDQVEYPAQPPKTVDRQMEMPVGAVPLTSPFYILRDADDTLAAAIARKESIGLVKGARQMGKTSLIARGLRLARDTKYKVAITDLQTLNESDLADLSSFYRAIASLLADQLDLDRSLEERWNDRRAPNVNFDRFIRKDVLDRIENHVVWALDEVDRLFPCRFSTEVFGLFRSWHNARALDPTGPWNRITLVIGFATEASLFIKDVNMSPFNVGTRVILSDFTEAEIDELNARYGHPLTGTDQVHILMERVGGQPFLVRRSLYALAVENASFEHLLSEASTDQGVFGDHLRRFHISLHRDSELEKAVRNFIHSKRELTVDQFHRLRSAGLVVGESRHDAKIRCGIYRDYLQRQLA